MFRSFDGTITPSLSQRRYSKVWRNPLRAACHIRRSYTLSTPVPFPTSTLESSTPLSATRREIRPENVQILPPALHLLRQRRHHLPGLLQRGQPHPDGVPQPVGDRHGTRHRRLRRVSARRHIPYQGASHPTAGAMPADPSTCPTAGECGNERDQQPPAE